MKRLVLLALLGLAPQALAAATQASFTPAGYKYPITKISLFKADSTGEQVLYQCTGATSAECLVDVTSEASLQAIEASALNVKLEPGEYDHVRLASCPAGTTGSDTMNVQVKGTATVGSDVFNTQDSAVGGMATGGEPEFIPVSLGCGGAVVHLREPLVVTDGSAQTLTLAIDLTHVTWTDAGASPGMGGCRADGTSGQDICTTMPSIIPFVGDGVPTFERYLVSHLAGAGTPAIEDANGSVTLAIDPEGEVFYVSVAPYYSETSPSWVDTAKGGPDYNTSTRTFSKNPDGTIAFQTGGDVTDDRVGFTAFARADHGGTCKDEGPASPVWNYQAFLQ